jgi:hypothetical protein
MDERELGMDADALNISQSSMKRKPSTTTAATKPKLSLIHTLSNLSSKRTKPTSSRVLPFLYPHDAT